MIVCQTLSQQALLPETLSIVDSRQLQPTNQSGALKLLNELETLSGLIGADISKSNVSQSVKTTTTQSKTVQLSKVSSAFHGQPMHLAIKGEYLDTKSGIYTDYSGHNYNLAEAFEKDLINPDSAVFINPVDNQSMTVHNAIQHGLVEPTGHYSDRRTGEKFTLADCMSKSIIVTREVEPIAVDTQKKEEHYHFHVDKVGLMLHFI